MNAEIIAQTLTRGTAAEWFVVHAYAPALFTHIASGVATLVAGVSAVMLPKGGRGHRIAGRVFVVAMLLIGVSAPVIAQSHIAMVIPVFAAYLVATAWRTITRVPETNASFFDIVALMVVLGVAACCFVFGRLAAATAKGALDGYPAAFHYVFGGLALAAGLADLNVLARRRFTGAPSVARHLGRMCFGLLLAGTSFFFGQQDRFPEVIRRSGVLAYIVLAPLAFMLFWLVRVRLMPRIKFHPQLEFTGRVIGFVYLVAVAIGLFGLFLPRRM